MQPLPKFDPALLDDRELAAARRDTVLQPTWPATLGNRKQIVSEAASMRRLFDTASAACPRADLGSGGHPPSAGAGVRTSIESREQQSEEVAT